MRVVLTALLVLPMAAASAQVLTVCEALDQLSELNGKEVEIRGAWQAGDTGEWLWAPEPCSHPIVRDGWVWKNTISIKREDANDYRRWRTISAQWSALKHGSPGPNLVLATLKGRLKTRDHFKVSRFSHLPEAYGYSPAVLVVSKAEHLQAVPCSNEQLARAEKEAVSPWPVRIKKAHP